MSLAISFGDFEDENSVSGAIYFNATTSYNRKYSGKVSEHPLEVGSKVSDHYSSDNAKFTIEGVISGVEISHIPQSISLDGEDVINNQQQPVLVSVDDSGSDLMSYIPEVITQFLPPMESLSVNMSSDKRLDKGREIEGLMKQLMNGVYYSEPRNKWENRMTPVTLYELAKDSVENAVGNLIITDFTVSEDAESGEGLFFNMTLEEVKFVTLDDADAPTPPPNTTAAIKTTENKDRGSAPTKDVAPAVVPDAPEVQPRPFKRGMTT